MIQSLFRKWRRSKRTAIIDPDDVLLDASNLPAFDRSQLEGRLAMPIGKRAFYTLYGIALIVAGAVIFQVASLQLIQGEEWAYASEDNRLRQSIIFTERGLIYDRTGRTLAWNSIEEGSETPYPLRKYATSTGLGHVLGYVQPPRADKSGVFYQTDYYGITGAEESFDATLKGKNGIKIVEANASGQAQSESVISPPIPGESLTLSLDARLTEVLHNNIRDLADKVPFQSGAGVVMDIHTGEILAMTSYPEYERGMFTDPGRRSEITPLLTDSRRPFLHRAIAGLYTPGSIVKPFLALGALHEGIIDPSDIIVSEGKITIPNPYDPEKPTIFRDWRAHGATDMERAIAVSSDVYFYSIGGGYRGQQGLGIGRIEKYLRMFGVGTKSGIVLDGEMEGVIPNPSWKSKTFPADPTWRIGDTYNSSIGQYGTQVTPLEMARATAALANGGTLLTPTILKGQEPETQELDFSEDEIDVIRRGMRRAVSEGTAAALAFPDLAVAGKTGTAEVGVHKEYINSWIIGFFPADKPKYAFAVIMERGKAGSTTGAPYVTRQFLDYMRTYTPEYLKSE